MELLSHENLLRLFCASQYIPIRFYGLVEELTAPKYKTEIINIYEDVIPQHRNACVIYVLFMYKGRLVLTSLCAGIVKCTSRFNCHRSNCPIGDLCA